MKLRQSDPASHSCCPRQEKLSNQVNSGLVGRPEQLCMTASGSVLHHPVHHLEKFKLEQSAHALGARSLRFDYHRDPTNITAITEAVTFRAACQTYAGPKRKGHQNTDLYARYVEGDQSKHLGLELDFDPPFDLDAGQHTFHRTMDRLSPHKLTGQPFIEVADLRTDQDYTYPLWNAKFSGYCWAAAQSKFWTDGWGQDEGEALKVGFSLLARRGGRDSLRNGVGRQDPAGLGDRTTPGSGWRSASAPRLSGLRSIHSYA
jgi:hypothetical protein